MALSAASTTLAAVWALVLFGTNGYSLLFRSQVERIQLTILASVCVLVFGGVGAYRGWVSFSSWLAWAMGLGLLLSLIRIVLSVDDEPRLGPGVIRQVGLEALATACILAGLLYPGTIVRGTLLFGGLSAGLFRIYIERDHQKLVREIQREREQAREAEEEARRAFLEDLRRKEQEEAAERRAEAERKRKREQQAEAERRKQEQQRKIEQERAQRIRQRRREEAIRRKSREIADARLAVRTVSRKVLSDRDQDLLHQLFVRGGSELSSVALTDLVGELSEADVLLSAERLQVQRWAVLQKGRPEAWTEEIALTRDGWMKAYGGPDAWPEARYTTTTFIERMYHVGTVDNSRVNSPSIYNSDVSNSFNTGSFNVGSLNNIRDEKGDDAANAFREFAEHVRASGNEDAIAALDEISQELVKEPGERKKPALLRTIVSGIVAGVPTLKEISETVEIVQGIFS